MKRLPKAIAFAAACTALGAALSASPAQAQTPNSGVYVHFTSHQDDDVLSHGALIAKEVRERGASNVFVYMFTDGGASGSTVQLSNWDHGADSAYQAADGQYVNDQRFASTNPNLRADLTAARDLEYRAAMAQLGVPAANVRVVTLDGTRGGFCAMRPQSNGSTNQTLLPGAILAAFKATTECTVPSAGSQAVADAAWQQIIATHGLNANYVTQSYVDPSNEHRVLGIGLKNLSGYFAPNAGRTGTIKYVYPQYQRGLTTASNLNKMTIVGDTIDYSVLNAAGKEYGVVDGVNRFGIGFISVAYAFGGPYAGQANSIRDRAAYGGSWINPGVYAGVQAHCTGSPGGSAALCANTQYFTGRSAGTSPTTFGAYGPGRIHSLTHN